MPILEEIREAAKGRNQQELADAVGINLVSLNRFLKGHRGISIETLQKLAEALGLDIVVKKRKRGGK